LGFTQFFRQNVGFNVQNAGFLNPFCHLVIKAIRWDSHPRHLSGAALKIALLDAELAWASRALNLPQN
jgi:hypothetical protein